MALAAKLYDCGCLFGIVAFVLWIVTLLGLLPLGGWAWIFFVVAVILLLVWILVRCLGIGSGGRGYYHRYRTPQQPSVVSAV
jgi:hypothetical protein